MVFGYLVGLAAVGSSAAAFAAEWSWQWGPAGGQAAPQVEVCRFQYGKEWAYAVEIDDGPAVMAKGLRISQDKPLQKMEVWVVEG